MVSYRRNYVPGGTYFFTVTLVNRRSDRLVRHIGSLRCAFDTVRKQKPFRIEAIGVLPDHLHAVLTLPPGDTDYPGRWKSIKAKFTHSLVAKGILHVRNSRGEYPLWQRRYWEHTIQDDRDFERHIDYIHFNPVKHGLVSRVADWPYSSFHRFVREGLLPQDWGGTDEDVIGNGGEPV